jgi:hypothetical protein
MGKGGKDPGNVGLPDQLLDLLGFSTARQQQEEQDRVMAHGHYFGKIRIFLTALRKKIVALYALNQTSYFLIQQT